MATGDRTDRIADRVQLLLGVKDFKLADVNVYGQIDDAQRRLCEELLCLEKSTAVLAFTSGAASEPSGFYKIKQLVLGTSASWQPTEVSVEDYDAITRQSPTTGFQTGEFYKRWAGTLTTYPALSDGNYTMYYYGIPTTNVTTAVDPETPAILDKCIEYLVATELAPYVGKQELTAGLGVAYSQELDRVRHSWFRTKPSGYGVVYHDV